MCGNGRESCEPIAAQIATLRRRKIRALNDRFRQTGQGGRERITPGLQGLGMADVLELRRAIAGFTDFTTDNDPYGEHDFGSLIFKSRQIFWKIDYFDLTLSQGSADPADPAITTRVLTIMLASEY